MNEIDGLLRDNKTARYCFFDAETCNLCLHEVNNLPWQISMINIVGQEITKSYDFYIKWPQGITVSKEAAAKTRYYPGTIEEKGISPEVVADAVKEQFDATDYIVGHNILGYDTYIVQALFRQLGREPYNIVPKVLDTLSIARAMKLEIQFDKANDDLIAWQYRLLHRRQRGLKCSLEALGKEFNIKHDYTQLHNALSDLELNVRVWNQLKYRVNI